MQIVHLIGVDRLYFFKYIVCLVFFVLLDPLTGFQRSLICACVFNHFAHGLSSSKGPLKAWEKLKSGTGKSSREALEVFGLWVSGTIFLSLMAMGQKAKS